MALSRWHFSDNFTRTIVKVVQYFRSVFTFSRFIAILSRLCLFKMLLLIYLRFLKRTDKQTHTCIPYVYIYIFKII